MYNENNLPWDMLAKKFCLDAAAASATSFASLRSKCNAMLALLQIHIIRKLYMYHLPSSKFCVLALSSSSSKVLCCRLAVRCLTRFSISFAYCSSYIHHPMSACVDEKTIRIISYQSSQVVHHVVISTCQMRIDGLDTVLVYHYWISWEYTIEIPPYS